MSRWLALARGQIETGGAVTIASIAPIAPPQGSDEGAIVTNDTNDTAPSIASPEVRARLSWAAQRLRDEQGFSPEAAAERARRIIAAELRNDPRLVPHQENAQNCLVCGEPGEVRRPLAAILTPSRGEALWMHPGPCQSAYIQQQQGRVEELMRAALGQPDFLSEGPGFESQRAHQLFQLLTEGADHFSHMRVITRSSR